MDSVNETRDRIQDARGLPELLDAACDAFEEMLTVIRQHDHPGGDWFVPMVMAGAWAGDGRDWLLFAPSLPPGRLAGSAHDPRAVLLAPVWLAGLCRTTGARLRLAASSAGNSGDRDACLGAARCAQEIACLMATVAP